MGRRWCAVISVLSVVAASMRVGRLGEGRPIILADILVRYVGEDVYGERAASSVQGDGFNNLHHRRSRRWGLTERALIFQMAQHLRWQR